VTERVAGAGGARSGPLSGVRVIELVGLGPGPFCGMLLGDLGADVLRIDRPDASFGERALGTLERGKHTAAVDLRQAEGVALVLDLVAGADVLVDVYRPGVTERLGIGPADCLARNPRLIYGRLTGWGQEGPLAPRAGHDLTYLAVSGALEPLGRADGPPTAPINVLADFAGGGMFLAFGIAAALVEVGRTGRGQVIDAAMVDGAATIMAPFYAGRANGGWGPRGTNHLDGGAPFYDVYETADGKWLALAAVEPHFHAMLIEGLGLAGDPDVAAQYDRSRWPSARKRIAAAVRSKTREEWVAVFDGTDACVAPVLDPVEATEHRHAVARQAFTTVEGSLQPARGPRFSETPLDPPAAGTGPEETAAALVAWGVDRDRIARLEAAGVVGRRA